MNNLPSKYLEQAVQALSSLPTIGRKSALRLAMHLLETDPDKSIQIAKALVDLIEHVNYCSVCGNISDEDLCIICKNPKRDQTKICIVEHFRDLLAIEETGQYHGLYHVLGGLISPIDGKRPEDLNLSGLKERCTENMEIIMAITPNIEGETTAFYIAKYLKDLNLSISMIARGVSFGGELEYADGYTLGHSILERRPYNTSKE